MSLLIQLAHARQSLPRRGQQPRRITQVAKPTPRFGGTADIKDAADRLSLPRSEASPQVVKPPAGFAPLPEQRIAYALQRSLGRAAETFKANDGTQGLNACVPDRPAEALLQSLITRVDSDDRGDEVPDRQESRVQGLPRKAAMVLQCEALLVCHAERLLRAAPLVKSLRRRA